MTDFTSQAVRSRLAHYDLSDIRRVADIGGGHVVMLVEILRRYSAIEGVLFDLPEVVAGAGERAHFAGLDGRLHRKAGSFFDDAPADCDAYLLKHILHDWDNEAAATILGRIRQRMHPAARVLVYEMIVGEDSAPSPAKVLDIEMLAVTPGGRERTEAEFRELFTAAGLRLDRIVPTDGPMAVLEARRA